MATFPIRTRIIDKRHSKHINSLEIQDVCKFIKATHLHQSFIAKIYLKEIINHFTNKQYEEKAEILAENGIFKIIEKRGSLHRPGDGTLYYSLIIYGRLAELRDGECLYYEAGEGIGDEEFLFGMPYRQNYVFECANNPVILCQLNRQHYSQIFHQKIENVTTYLHIINSCQIFSDVDHVRKVLLLKDSQVITLKKGQKLYDQGTEIKGIYIVLQGIMIELIKYTKGQIGDVMPYELVKEVDFDKYVESYDAKRYNQLTQIEAKVTYGQMDTIGLLEIYEMESVRLNRTICIQTAKLLFIPLGNLRRYGQIQQNLKKKLFKRRRKSQLKNTRHRTLQSRSVTNSRNSPDRYQFRKLRYDRQLL